MKTFKNLNGAFGAAALLLGTMAFTACSSDDIANVNPTFDGKAVKTQFAISIPAGGQQTRVAQEVAQGQTSPVFRGMSNIRLIPFSAAVDAKFENDAIILTDIAKTGDLDKNAKFYSDVTVPIGTNRFLFYAEATRSSGATDKDNGALVINNDLTTGLLSGKNISDIKFQHNQINANANTDIQTYLAGILNGVAGSFTGLTDPKDVAAFDNLKKTKVGSSSAIKAVMKDIYNTVSLAVVKSKIEEYFDTASDFAYKTDAAGYVADADNYPGCLGIPEGAAQVKYNNNSFAYEAIGAEQQFGTYVFPASLYYWVNSEVGVATEKKSEKWNGTSTTDWSSFITTNYSEKSVESSTQSIVLESPVQYAVSQLVYNVKFGAEQVMDKASHPVNVMNGEKANFQLKGILIGGQKAVDYKFEQLETETETARTIYDASIGGTLQNVTTATGSANYYSLALQTEKRTANTDTGDQKTVNIALEMVNNSGNSFIGKDNEVIPDGGTFYLRGVLSTKITDTENNYVFEQDHKTKANITINSLATAEYTIPDLRKTELELGLYVDLEWQDGLVYDVIIGD